MARERGREYFDGPQEGLDPIPNTLSPEKLGPRDKPAGRNGKDSIFLDFFEWLGRCGGTYFLREANIPIEICTLMQKREEKKNARGVFAAAPADE